MTISLSIIIPTRNRGPILETLLTSIKSLQGLERIGPEIIVGDNHSDDNTWDLLQRTARQFPVTIKLLKVQKRGKSAVLNEAVLQAKGKVLAFLDDDVVVDEQWLAVVENFFETKEFMIGQGVVRFQSPESEDPEIRKLLDRYRTIPHLDFGADVKVVHSLNGANFAVSRTVLDQTGCFNERLGPGASGTSEDVELARRIQQAGFKIGYMKEAIVHHRVDRSRLTEEYFRITHKRQGVSRGLLKNRGVGRIVFDLARVSAQFGLYSIIGSERARYRSKGRIYHYVGMLEAKFKGGARGLSADLL